MHFTIHQPVKTTKQVNRVVSLPADISLTWFLARTKSLASRTLAEVAMQAKIYDRIFLGRRGKFRGRASTLRVPLARLKPEILTGLHTMWKETGKKRPPAGIQNEKQETARSLPDAERN